MDAMETQAGQTSPTVPPVPLVIHYADGQKAQEVTFVDGLIEGEAVQYDRSGQVSARLNFRRGVLEGPMTVFAQGRKIADMTYKEGELDGAATFYDAAGGIQMISTYRRGMLDGMQQSYYPNGQAQRVTPYKDGKIEGEVVDYRDDGSVRQRTLWREGVPVPSASEPASQAQPEIKIEPVAAPRKRSWIDIMFGG